MRVCVSFDWRNAGAVTLGAGGLQFPRLPDDAGVYRFRFTGIGQEGAYIGEASQLLGSRGVQRALAGDGGAHGRGTSPDPVRNTRLARGCPGADRDGTRGRQAGTIDVLALL